MRKILQICLIMMLLPGYLWAGNESSMRADRLPTSGIYAYVTDLNDGVRIIDVSDPENPTEVGFYDTPGAARDVYVSENHAYIADGLSGLRIIDVSDPASPTEAGYYDTPGYACGVYVSGSYAYVADEDETSGLLIIDVSDPANPFEAGFCGAYHCNAEVEVSDNYAYAGTTTMGFAVIDVSDPEDPFAAGYYQAPLLVESAVVSGRYAYLGLFGFKNINKAALSERYTHLSKEYYVDWLDYFEIIDVINPSNPIKVGSYPVPSYVMGVAVAGNYAYLAAYEAGLRIIDISNPVNPVEVGNYDASGNYNYEISVLGNYAYIADFGGYFRVIDVSDPAIPSQVGLIVNISGAYSVYAVDYEPPQVTVISPNGGEGFEPGDICDITWLAEDNVGVDSISIFYSIDAGSSWETIASGEANDSTYSWTIPNTPSDNCLVKILAYDPSHNTDEDQSDSFFSISTQGIGENSSSPGSLVLLQIVPNPFRGSTEITFSMGQSERGNRITSGSMLSGSCLKIYDAGGRLIRQWNYSATDQSCHAVWDGRDDYGCEVSAGVYLVRFETQDHAVTEKLILLK